METCRSPKPLLRVRVLHGLLRLNERRVSPEGERGSGSEDRNLVEMLNRLADNPVSVD